MSESTKHLRLFLRTVLCSISCICCTEQHEDCISFVSGDKILEKLFNEAAVSATEETPGGGRFFRCREFSGYWEEGCTLSEIFDDDSVTDPDYAGAALNYVIEHVIGYRSGTDGSSFCVLSSVSDGTGYIGVKNLPVGRNKVDIIQEAANSTVVSNRTGPTDIRCAVCFAGDYQYITIGETIFMASHDVMDGKNVCKVDVSIPPGGSIRLYAVPE